MQSFPLHLHSNTNSYISNIYIYIAAWVYKYNIDIQQTSEPKVSPTFLLFPKFSRFKTLETKQATIHTLARVTTFNTTLWGIATEPIL